MICTFYHQHHFFINNAVGWGIAIVFGAIAMTRDQLGYPTSFACGPNIMSGLFLVSVPLLVYMMFIIVLLMAVLAQSYKVRNR